MIRRCLFILAGSLLALSLPATVRAQGGRSEIRGTISDTADAVLPGVNVTVTNEATGLTRSVVSGPEGRFVVPSLLPGTYTVKAALAGFQGSERKGLIVNVGQEL